MIPLVQGGAEKAAVENGADDVLFDIGREGGVGLHPVEDGGGVGRSGAQLGAVDDYGKPGGTERFYAMMLSNHDSKGYSSQGDIIAFAYQAILSPFLPIWFLGEEWNNP